MSSELQVPVTTISNIKKHPSADRLQIAEILGWQCVVPKGIYFENQAVVYFPPDTLLPTEVSDKMGVTQYLSVKQEGNESWGRVRSIRLRGEPSFGFCHPVDILKELAPDKVFSNDENVADLFRAKKYEPPIRNHHVNGSKGFAEDSLPDHPLFPRYTDIENFRRYPNIIEEGEDVIISEKLDGQLCRIGHILDGESWVWMAGSNRVRRSFPKEDVSKSQFWYPFESPELSNLILHLSQKAKQVIVYGESYGASIQKFKYDSPNKANFRMFDILVDGKYLDFPAFAVLAVKFHVPTVPMLFTGKFSKDLLQLADGESMLGGNCKEGIVIAPVKERLHPKTGRVKLKYHSNEYLIMKGKKGFQDYTDV